jgi:hypothetical protein
MKKIAAAGLAAAAVLAGALPAFAHHSFSMFDRTKQIDVKGTVSEFQFVNPHVWLWMMVPDANGQSSKWGFEGEAVSVWMRKGVKKNSLAAGEQITVRANPMKDGAKAGFILGITKADGTKLDPTNQAPDVGG